MTREPGLPSNYPAAALSRGRLWKLRRRRINHHVALRKRIGGGGWEWEVDLLTRTVPNVTSLLLGSLGAVGLDMERLHWRPRPAGASGSRDGTSLLQSLYSELSAALHVGRLSLISQIIFLVQRG